MPVREIIINHQSKKRTIMKHLFIAAIAGLISLNAQAQVSETRSLKEVTSIEVKNGIEVIFTQSDTLALMVEADNIKNLYNIATEYKGHTLKIYLKDADEVASVTRARVYVSQKELKSLKASNAATIRVDGLLNVNDASFNISTGAMLSAIITSNGICKIDLKSGSGFRGKITTNKLDANILSGSFMKVTGTADATTLFCSGGSFTADKFVCSEADVRAQNASAVSIFTKNSIKTDVDPSSSVTYYGEPAKISLGNNAVAVKRDNYRLSLK
jgi:hypothetical protein